VATIVVDAQNRDVPRRVACCRDGNDAAVVAERPALREGAERTAVQRERLEIDIGRHRLANHPLRQPRGRGAGICQLPGVHQHGSADVHCAVHVVAMQVGQHNGVDVRERQPGPR
jgi:hypothetical protein